MSTSPEFDLPRKENWGSKIGVIAAVAGSAVGLGNFLRFPGTAVNNGGGAFMIPYIISFLILGIPIAWCEWTMGRLGGSRGQNNGPGILYSLWQRAPAKAVGALTLIIPITVYMYYVLLEALCLRYSIEFFSRGFADLFGSALAEAGENAGTETITEAAGGFAVESFGLAKDGQMYRNAMFWLVPVCFLVNFVIIYRGVTKGIERFCVTAMPLLIGCAIIILLRVLTLDNVVDGRTINGGLGFMWNPDWAKLREPEVWLRAAGQIFFSLSVGFGLILCYSSYLRRDDDVVLASLSASSTNEFCEVILGGMIIVPAAFLFLGAENATGTTFGLGFVTVPAIMHYMPGGSFFGGMWFGLLFIAAVTSSISMLQPAIAFLEDGFGLRRRASVTILGLVTLLGAAPIMYFSTGATALDFTDFWCEFMMILAGLGQVLIFGWIIGAEKGVEEANRGAAFRIPKFMGFVIRYVTPSFLLIVLCLWFYFEGPDRVRGMVPSIQGAAAVEQVYTNAVKQQPEYADLDDAAIAATVGEVFTEEFESSRPDWAREAVEQAAEAREAAESTAMVAAFVFVCVCGMFILIYALSDMACRSRIGRMPAQSEPGEGI